MGHRFSEVLARSFALFSMARRTWSIDPNLAIAISRATGDKSDLLE